MKVHTRSGDKSAKNGAMWFAECCRAVRKYDLDELTIAVGAVSSAKARISSYKLILGRQTNG